MAQLTPATVRIARYSHMTLGAGITAHKMRHNLSLPQSHTSVDLGELPHFHHGPTSSYVHINSVPSFSTRLEHQILVTFLPHILSHLYSAVRDYPVVLNIDRACASAPR